MALLIIVITTPLLVFAGVAILNALTFPRLRRSTAPIDGPHLTILIPARNEAAVIGATVRHLLDQDYPHFDVMVLDDDSADGTGDLARAVAAGDLRLRVIGGAPLPPGWLGKNWACYQLAEQAEGEWLIFTDADVRWEPGALAAVAAQMASTRADLLTVWPTQITETWGERLVVPLMALAIIAYLPLLPVHHTRLPAFAAANGQCLAFRRSAYRAVGGHTAVRDRVVEDVAFARQVKAAGLRLRMADGGGLVACRMYRNWAEVRAGFGKNILAGHGDSLVFLAFSTVFHWLVFVGPWLWLLLSPGLGPLALIALGVGVRALTAAVTRQRLRDALLMPVSVILMTIIAGQAVWWRLRYGGPRWKDRTIRLAKGAAHE